jgi:hypothetical protein
MLVVDRDEIASRSTSLGALANARALRTAFDETIKEPDARNSSRRRARGRGILRTLRKPQTKLKFVSCC